MSTYAPAKVTIRKSITLPDAVWRAVRDYRFEERLDSDAEAVRRLLDVALRQCRAGKASRGTD